MSYDQLLQDYLKKIDRYEGLKELSSSVDPVGEVNDILKKLNRDDWEISINSRFRYSVLAEGYGVKDYNSLKIEPFEDFKASLSGAIACNLVSTQAGRYTDVAKYEREAVDVAIGIVDSIDESLYEELMNALRSIKDSNSKQTSKNLKKKKDALYADIQEGIYALANEWLKENIAPGTKVTLENYVGVFTVEKVARMNGTISVKLKEMDDIVDITELGGYYSWSKTKDCKNIRKRWREVK